MISDGNFSNYLKLKVRTVDIIAQLVGPWIVAIKIEGPSRNRYKCTAS